MIRRVFRSGLFGLVFVLLSIHPITGFAMTNAEEQEAVRAFKLTPDYLERWITAREQAIEKNIPIGTFELRDPEAKGDVNTPERRYTYLENLPGVMPLLARQHLSLSDFIYGSRAVLAAWIAQSSSAPESIASANNIQAVADTKQALAPIMEHDFAVELEQRLKR